jgi:hypothetical protein
MLLRLKIELFEAQNKLLLDKLSTAEQSNNFLASKQYQLILQERTSASAATTSHCDIDSSRSPRFSPEHFKLNIDFLTNIIKLKMLEKDFKLNSQNNNETIMECLHELVQQIRFFFFEAGMLVHSLFITLLRFSST